MMMMEQLLEKERKNLFGLKELSVKMHGFFSQKKTL